MATDTTTTTPKAQPVTTAPTAPNVNFDPTLVAGLNPVPLADFMKAYNIPAVYKGVDYSKMNLTYKGVPPNSGTALINAVLQLEGEYPALGAVIMDHLGITATAGTTQTTDAFRNLEKAGFDLVKTESVPLSAAKAQATFYQNEVNSGIAAGLSSTTASTEANAFDNIKATIDNWNYSQEQKDFLTSQMAMLVMRNGNHIVNQKSLMGVLRGQDPSGLGAQVDAKIKAEYQNAFPGLTEYNNSPNAERMTENQYMTYATKIMDTATQYGAPMPSRNDIGKLLVGNVSAAEYSQRVNDIYAVVSNADPNVKRILREEYGVGPGQLMHYFMDPKNALQSMQRQVASAEIQDYSQRVGLGGLGKGEADNLAQMAKMAGTAGNQGLGYGVSTVENSLLGAARDVGLTRSLPGASAPTVDTKTLIASQLAGFGGINQVAAQTEVARAEQAKAAPFDKGGGYAENAKGVMGLGSART